MLSPGLETLLKPQAFTLRIVWGAMTFAVVIYGVVGFVMSSTPMPPSPELAMMRIVFGVVGLAAGLSSFVVPRFLPSDDAIRKAMAADPNVAVFALNPQTGRPDPARAAALTSLSLPEQRLLLAAPLATSQAVVRLALSEMPAVMGFVLTTMSHQPLQYLSFGAFSIALMTLAYPRLDSLLERASSLG